MAAFYSTRTRMYDVDRLVPEKESGNIAYMSCTSEIQ